MDDIWFFMASMLYLGNITFGDGDVAAVLDSTPMQKAQDGLGCGDFTQLLIKKACSHPLDMFPPPTYHIISGSVTLKDHVPTP